MQDFKGQCHCGNLSYHLAWPDDETMRGRQCQCQYCRMHGAIWTSHPHARVEVGVQDHHDVLEYRFGQRTAIFHVCARCGVLPVATCEFDNARLSVININTFNAPLARDVELVATNFDGEAPDERLQRRQARWSPTTFNTD